MPDAFLLQLVAIVTSLSSTPPLSWANLLFYDWWLRWFLMTFGRLGWHAGWYDYTGCIIMMIVIFCFWGAPMMMLLYRSESSSGFYSSFRWPAGTVMMMMVVSMMMMMMILPMAGSAANLPFINSAPRYRVCMTGGWPVWYHHDCHHLHSYKWGKTTPDHPDIHSDRAEWHKLSGIRALHGLATASPHTDCQHLVREPLYGCGAICILLHIQVLWWWWLLW